MNKLIACLALATAFFALAPAQAQFAESHPEATPIPPGTVITKPDGPLGIPLVAPGPPSVVTIPPAAPSGAPPVTQNTVTTSGPVSSETTISVGTLAGQVLTWAATAFGSVLATVFAAWGVRLFKLAGVQISDAARDRLQQIILNGLNAGAKEAQERLADKDPVTIKNATVASAIAYTQAHGADSIKALGLDPTSGAAVEAIKARIETAVADPSVPTPAVLDTPAPVAARPPTPQPEKPA